MLLYCIRHGIAENVAESGRDADRQLTPEGAERTGMVATAMSRIGVYFDRIISSPYLRAMQTAEILARAVNHPQDIFSDTRLVPSAHSHDAAGIILEHRDAESILFVGHEPSMGYIISGLCAMGHLQMEVKKASVTALQITRLHPQPAGCLLWTLPPKIILALDADT